MTDAVRAACEANFEAHEQDCSGFARAVAQTVKVPLNGLADDIVNTLRAGGSWVRLADGKAALQSAKDGKLVIAGMKGAEQTHPDPHGHVVIVVDGPLARNAYPTAYWGSLGDEPGRGVTLNFAWIKEDRDRIFYAAHSIPSTKEPKASA